MVIKRSCSADSYFLEQSQGWPDCHVSLSPPVTVVPLYFPACNILCLSFLVFFLLDFLGPLYYPYSVTLPVSSPSFCLNFLTAFVHNLTILSKARDKIMQLAHAGPDLWHRELGADTGGDQERVERLPRQEVAGCSNLSVSKPRWC